MPQSCRGADLGEEAFGPEPRREIRTQHLQRHLAVVPQVMREVDGGHAASAEDARELVAVGKGCSEVRRDTSHDRHRMRRSQPLHFRPTLERQCHLVTDPDGGIHCAGQVHR